MTELKPWLSPDETVEALELMFETMETLRNVAQFGSLRSELRSKLRQQASKLEYFVSCTRHPRVDHSLILAIDEMVEKKKTNGGTIAEIMRAMENHISAYNKKR